MPSTFATININAAIDLIFGFMDGNRLATADTFVFGLIFYGWTYFLFWIAEIPQSCIFHCLLSHTYAGSLLRGSAAFPFFGSLPDNIVSPLYSNNTAKPPYATAVLHKGAYRLLSIFTKLVQSLNGLYHHRFLS